MDRAINVRIFRCGYRRPICRIPTLQHLVAEIVFHGDLEKLENIIQRRREEMINEYFIDWVNDTLLRAVLNTTHPNSMKEPILKYILSMENFNVNYVNTNGENCLMRSQFSNYPESILDELLKRGADIKVRDFRGCTLLHTGLSDSFEAYEIALMEKAIRQGVDVNAEDANGRTALFIACERKLPNWIYFYLYHGANAAIPSAVNILPLCVLSETYDAVAYDLLDYTFEVDASAIHLRSMIKLMQKPTELFQNICARCRTIEYDVSDLDYFAENLQFSKANNFELFMKYYGYIIKELIFKTSLLKILLDSGLDMVLPELKGLLLALLHSEYVTLLVQQHWDLTYPIVTCLIKVFNSHEDMFFTKEEITEIVLILLEHGLTISLRDLDTVYKYYGYGNLLKILLHMDVIHPTQKEKYFYVDHSSLECEISYIRDREPIAAMVQLLHNPNKTIEDCWNDPPAYLDLLKLFNNAKVKELIALHCQSEVLEALKSMPRVPLLIELSRNATRKFIMERYKIKKQNEFYTILKNLSLPVRYRRILSLEDVLYHPV